MFIEFWETKNSSVKKEGWMSNEGMVKWSPIDTIAEKLYSARTLARHMKGKSEKSKADCHPYPALVNLPTGQPSLLSLLPINVHMH